MLGKYFNVLRNLKIKIVSSMFNIIEVHRTYYMYQTSPYYQIYRKLKNVYIKYSSQQFSHVKYSRIFPIKFYVTYSENKKLKLFHLY